MATYGSKKNSCTSSLNLVLSTQLVCMLPFATGKRILFSITTALPKKIYHYKKEKIKNIYNILEKIMC